MANRKPLVVVSGAYRQLDTGADALDASIAGNAATVTNGVYTTGDQNIAGKKVMTPTVATGASTEQAFRINPNVLAGSPEWRNMFNIQSTYNAGANGHGFYIKANASNQFEIVTDWSTHLRLGVITNAGSAANATAAKYLNLTTAAITWDGNALLDAVNYTTYTVTKTGTGASGTWGISITGSAATITGVYGGTLTSGQVTTALGYTPQTALTLTTTGTSGAATLVGGTLNIPQYAGGGSGTVTSVGLSLPALFTVTNSPVTGSGTLTGAFASQTANTVLAAPNGSAGAPTMRALVEADVPTLSQAKITNLTTDLAAKAPLASPTFTGTVLINNGAGSEGGEIRLQKPPTGSSLAGDVTVDIATNSFRVFEAGGSFRGFFVDLTGCIGQSALLHSENYNNYAPTKTGTGASGSWGISVSGNAATVTNGVYTTGDQTIGGTKTFSSNPVYSAGTANGVAYLNGSKVLTSSSGLTFTGTNFVIGLGVTPSAWGADSFAMQMGARGAIYGKNSTTVIANNYFDSGAGSLYIVSAAASDYYQLAGAHIWRTAASGTAGASASLSQVMSLSAAGNLTVTGSVTAPNLIGSAATLTTARTLTIGSTGKTFNGSANVTWTLGEIGAQGALTLTTTGTSGAATLVGNTLNIPNYASGGGSGTVTSVGLSLPAIFSVSGSPVTGAGTLTATLASQTANLVWASPNGTAGAPTFRALVEADIPALAQSKITNLTTDLAAKAPLASPTFTGTPAAPTAAVGTNTTQLATTAFVQAELVNDAVLLTGNQTVAGNKTFSGTTALAAGSTIDGAVIGYRDIPLTVTNTGYTFGLADAGKGFGKDAATAYTYNIPANSFTAFPVGTAITVFNNNATANVTIAITTDTLRLGGTTTTGSRTLAPFGVCTLLKVASTVWIASGAGLT